MYKCMYVYTNVQPKNYVAKRSGRNIYTYVYTYIPS